MLKLKKQNGITLIALIITIIVMLILVGVTVNVTLNGGLFDKAKEAATKQERAAEMDILQAEALLAMSSNGKVDFSKIKSYEGKTETYLRKTTGTYITETGNVYTLDEDGTVTDITEFAKYILGEDLQGRFLTNMAITEGGGPGEGAIVGIDPDIGLVLVQDPENSKTNIHEETTLHMGDDIYEEIISCISDETMELYAGMVFPVQYKGDYYYFGCVADERTGDLYSAEESLFKIPTGNQNLGKYVIYKGITWRVINDSDKVELLSADSLGSVKILGRNCDNAYSIILDECKEETGITENIRPISYPTDLMDADIDSKIEGILVTGEPYWLSGTSDNTTHPESGRDITEIHYIKSDGTFGREPMNSWWYDAGAWEILESGATYAVRPVVTLPAGSLDNVSGDGSTPDTAIQLD